MSETKPSAWIISASAREPVPRSSQLIHSRSSPTAASVPRTPAGAHGNLRAALDVPNALVHKATVRRPVPAPVFVLGAAVSVQGGAAVAKSLFPELGPPGVVFLRLLFGGIVLWAFARPALRGRSARDLGLVALLGVTLVCMNLAFYESLDRLPLGIAVTVAFVG